MRSKSHGPAADADSALGGAISSAARQSHLESSYCCLAMLFKAQN